MPKQRFVVRDPASGAVRVLDRRRTIARSALGMAEHVAISAANSAPYGFTNRLRVALTYYGAAHWSVARHTEVIDANRSLVLHAGDEFADRQIGRDGRASVLLSPSRGVAEELFHAAPRIAAAHAMSLPASMRLRLLTHHLLALDASDGGEPLFADELMIAALRESLGGVAGVPIVTPATRIIRRAKEILHEGEVRTLRLDAVAREAGCSPVYLTQAFRRAEGVPLYRYHMRLRLTQVLLDLAEADDLTALALDHGFSSHSHLTSSFRAAFGTTPSQVRAELRARARPLPRAA